MNKQKVIEFYTIHKKEFCYHTQRIKDKKYKFFTKGPIFPPTAKSVHKIKRKPHRTLSPIGFSKHQIEKEVAEKFADMIEVQNKIVAIIKKRVEKFNYRCGIIKLKTGGGKSIICMDIIEYLQLTTLILVSNKKLMSEMIEKFSKMTNITPCQYGDGKKEIGFITVMTKSSFLKAKQDELEDFDCVLVDEMQTGFSDKYIAKMNTAFKGKDMFVYALSGTVFTEALETKDLEKYYGKIIEIKNEYNFIPKFLMYTYYNKKEEIEFEHYAELKQLLIDDTIRYEEQHNSIMNNLSDKCSLILTDRLEEADRYEKEFFEFTHTYTVIKITGETKVSDDHKKLEKALEEYKKNKKPIIIIGSIQKVSTGFDFPIIDTVFIYSSIKFEATVIQSVGRCLRKFEDKTSVRVVLWNDTILAKQRLQKVQAICSEYGITKKDIREIKIGQELGTAPGGLALTF